TRVSQSKTSKGTNGSPTTLHPKKSVPMSAIVTSAATNDPLHIPGPSAVFMSKTPCTHLTAFFNPVFKSPVHRFFGVRTRRFARGVGTTSQLKSEIQSVRRHKSITTSHVGCEQQTRTLPSDQRSTISPENSCQQCEDTHEADPTRRPEVR